MSPDNPLDPDLSPYVVEESIRWDVDNFSTSLRNATEWKK